MVADFINKHLYVRNAFLLFCIGFVVSALATKNDPFVGGLVLAGFYSILAGLDALNRRMTGPKVVTIKNQPRPKLDS